MDLLFVVVFIFVIVSIVSGASQAKKNTGGFNSLNSQKDSNGYRKDYSKSSYKGISSLSELKNEVMRELNQASQQFGQETGSFNKTVMHSKQKRVNTDNYAQIPGRQRKGFNNHSLSRELISDEMNDSSRLWLEEQTKMYEVNRKFNEDIARMHAENEKLMFEASKTDMR